MTKSRTWQGAVFSDLGILILLAPMLGPYAQSPICR